jgi:shikimate 5-dehydrogenase
METYPGQATISDLENVYHYRAIDRATRLIGVTGFTEQTFVTVAMLNAAMAHLGLPARCLPLQVGSVPLFRKVMEAVRLAGVVVDEPHHGQIVEIATTLETVAKHVQAADLLLHKDEQWTGYHTLCRAAVATLEATLAAKFGDEKPLQGRTAMIVGVNATARALIYSVQRRGGIPIVASHDRDAAHELAQQFSCRYVQFEALYSMAHDILIVCDEEKDTAKQHGKDLGIHGGYLKPGMAVMDLTSMPCKSALLRDAELRGCPVVAPRQVLRHLVELQIKLISGKDVPHEPLQAAMAAAVGEEE